MSQKYQMSREEQEYKEWKHRRSTGQADLLEGCKEVCSCYRDMELELVEGLPGAVRPLLLQSPERKNFNPKATVTRIKRHLSRIDKLCNEVMVLHGEIRQLKFEYGTPNRKEKNE